MGCGHWICTDCFLKIEKCCTCKRRSDLPDIFIYGVRDPVEEIEELDIPD